MKGKRKKYVRCLQLMLLAVAALVFGCSASAAGKEISQCKVTLSKETFYYDGSIQGPTVTVRDGETVLTKGEDYTLYGAGASTVGKHEITIVGKGGYTGQTEAVFEIKKSENKIVICNSSIYNTYSGPIQTTVICAASGDAALTYSTSTKGVSITKDGRLTVKDGFLGKIKIRVKASETEEYQASSAVFTLNVSLIGTSITEIKGEGVMGFMADDDHTACVNWDASDTRMQSVDGFQIRYSTDKNFKKKVYSVKVPMLSGLGGLVSGCSISSHLVKGQKTYFQIRTYKKALDGKMYYSEWSESVAHKVDSSAKHFYKGKSPKNGEEYVIDGIKYQYKNKKLTAVGVRKLTTANHLIIPATVSIYGKKYPVTAIKAGAFQRVTGVGGLYKITIGKNVSSIGKNAFADNYFIKNITIKSKKLTAKSVGKNAFKDVGKYSFTGTVRLTAPKGKKTSYKNILKKAKLKRNLT